MDTSLYIDNAYGITLGLFRTTGTADTDLYAPEQDAGSRTGKPDTNGYLIQADWTPYANTPRADNPWVNLRLGIQYTGYNRFNGAKNNYDGFGRDAKDNNTVMLFSWLVF